MAVRRGRQPGRANSGATGSTGWILRRSGLWRHRYPSLRPLWLDQTLGTRLALRWHWWHSSHPWSRGAPAHPPQCNDVVLSRLLPAIIPADAPMPLALHRYLSKRVHPIHPLALGHDALDTIGSLHCFGRRALPLGLWSGIGSGPHLISLATDVTPK